MYISTLKRTCKQIFKYTRGHHYQTRSQHYASQLNCHTQIYFLHSLTSSNGLFRKQPVFLVPAADQSIHSVHAVHAAFLFLPLKDSHSPLAPGRPLKRGKFFRRWLSKRIKRPLSYSSSNIAFQYAFTGTWNKHLVGYVPEGIRS